MKEQWKSRPACAKAQAGLGFHRSKMRSRFFPAEGPRFFPLTDNDGN